MTPRKATTLVAVLLMAGAVIVSANNIVETNQSGDIQIKQAAVTGKMSVKTTPGMYLQGFGQIHDYRISDENYFTQSAEEGGAGEMEAPVPVLFSDGSVVQVQGMIKYRLPQDEATLLKLHRNYRTYENFQQSLVRQTVQDALMQAGSLMTAEELYSARKSEFAAVAKKGLKEGTFEAKTVKVEETGADGTTFVKNVAELKVDENGKYIVTNISPFKEYNVEITQFVIKKPIFDDKIQALIDKKKEAEQQKVVAIANAEKAKQDAITTKEQGKAMIAEAEAKALIKKKTAVINAEKEAQVAVLSAKKEKDVATQLALKADEEAKATIAKGTAEATAAKLKVAAGLTPMQKATIEKDTAIGIAGEMAKIGLPKVMIFGGAGGTGSPMNPFDAVGLDAFMKITDSIQE